MCGSTCDICRRGTASAASAHTGGEARPCKYYYTVRSAVSDSAGDGSDTCIENTSRCGFLRSTFRHTLQPVRRSAVPVRRNASYKAFRTPLHMRNKRCRRNASQYRSALLCCAYNKNRRCIFIPAHTRYSRCGLRCLLRLLYSYPRPHIRKKIHGNAEKGRRALTASFYIGFAVQAKPLLPHASFGFYCPLCI